MAYATPTSKHKTEEELELKKGEERGQRGRKSRK